MPVSRHDCRRHTEKQAFLIKRRTKWMILGRGKTNKNTSDIMVNHRCGDVTTTEVQACGTPKNRK